MSTGQRRSRLCRGGGPGASHRPRFPSSPPVPSASGPLPRAPLPGRGVTWPRRRGSTAGGGQLQPPERRQPPGRDTPSGQSRTQGCACALLESSFLPLSPALLPASALAPPLPSPGLVAGPVRGVGLAPGDAPLAAHTTPPAASRDGTALPPPAGPPGSPGPCCRLKPSQVTKSNLKPGTINEDFCRPWRLVLPGTKINARNRNLIT